MKNVLTGPPETKVAVSAGVGIIISFLLSAIQFYAPSFRSPPAALVSLGITAIGLIVGYLAPHTPRGTKTVALPLSATTQQALSPNIVHIVTPSVQLSTAPDSKGVAT